ncbi:olfactory receptor 52J3-like [Paramacrobiotus metropolitanus]|uniref:olfactory receptor 52J3-like n=1 Tax=Paramacrobiotus metropolitanus TaxID=2943436 RepID=UPI002445A924|nr:olfactory receptor 52J3-like [Paramacrobiotus metropolitanus]
MENLTEANWTNVSHPDGWSYQAGVRISLGVIQFILNLTMLIPILILRDLRNAFTVYVAALFTANLVYVSTEYPIDVLRIVYSEQSFSSSVCTFYLYLVYVFAVVRLHMHVLITINRIWAIQFPVHYRNVHNERVAVLVCLGTVLYIHILILPLIIIDLLYYRLPEQVYGCGLASDQLPLFEYELIVEVLADDLLIVVIIVAYPFLYYKRWKAIKNRENTPEGQAASHPFLLLTLLTLGIVVASAPASVYSTLMYLVQPEDYHKYTGFERAAQIMASLLPVIDPIVFGLSLRNVREFFQKGLEKINLNRVRRSAVFMKGPNSRVNSVTPIGAVV